MTLERIFKNFILAEVCLILFILIAVIFEPEEITIISESLGPGFLDNDLGGIIAISFFTLSCAGLFLIYKFVYFGKTLFVILFIVTIFLSPFIGPSVLSPLVSMLEWLEGVTNGAILVFLYFTPIKDKFIPQR
jgi:hypothetical protein